MTIKYNCSVYSDERISRAYAQLQSEEFTPVLQHLRNRLDILYSSLAQQTEMHTVYRIQGEIKAVKEFLDKVAESR